jgi:hypothetical protein
MAVVVNEMEVVSEERGSGAGASNSNTPTPMPESLLQRQVEQAVRRSIERAKRLLAD